MGGKKKNKWEFYKECHTGTIKVFETEYLGKKLEFYAGGDSRSYNPHEVDITIALNDISVMCSNILDIYNPPDPYYVYVPVRDFHAPEYNKFFWFDLLDKIVNAFNGKDKIKIGVKCTGGHGRTGTVLAVYAGLLLDVDDPVKFVRMNYCENAVESMEQIEYVEKITGKKTTEKPSKGYAKVVGYQYYYFDDYEEKDTKTDEKEKDYDYSEGYSTSRYYLIDSCKCKENACYLLLVDCENCGEWGYVLTNTLDVDNYIILCDVCFLSLYDGVDSTGKILVVSDYDDLKKPKCFTVDDVVL